MFYERRWLLLVHFSHGQTIVLLDVFIGIDIYGPGASLGNFLT